MQDMTLMAVFILLLAAGALLYTLYRLHARLAEQGRALEYLKREVFELRNIIGRPGKTDFTPESKIETETPPPVQEVAPSPQPAAPMQRAESHDAPAQSPAYVPPAAQSADEPEPELRSPGFGENWVGRNVLGIAASVLVFVGLIFLGILVYGHLTDTVKIVLLFAISTVITGVGMFLCRRGRNAFTVILAGCGYGSFFISIMLTHLYFDALPAYAAFPLLLLWIAAALYSARLFESVSLSIVAHIGMAISICFAYTLSFTYGRLIPLLVYQLAAVALITVGNILCCKKTYRFGLFISMALTLIVSMFMWGRFPASYSVAYSPFGGSGVSAGLISAVFIAQFIGASFLSYLLAVSANRLENPALSKFLHGLNKLLWIGALFLNVYQLTYRLGFGALASDAYLSAVFWAVAVTFAITAAHTALTIFIRIKLNFSRSLEAVSAALTSVTALILMLLLWHQTSYSSFPYPELPLLFIPGGLLLLAAYKARGKVYTICANAFFALDFVLVLTSGYHELTKYGTIWLSLGYMLYYPAVVWGQWYALGSDRRGKHIVPAKLITYIAVQLSLAVILLDAPLRYNDVILMLVMTGAHILLSLLRYDGGNRVLNAVQRVGAHIWIAFAAVMIAFAYKRAIAPYYLLAALSAVLAFMRMRKTLEQGGGAAEVFCGLKLTLLTLAFVYGFTSWFEQVYIFSLVCMLTALASVVAGFIFRAKNLRLYGLFLTLLCVLKLVTVDVAGLETALRVVSLIGGGIICFIISAVYSYIGKKVQGRA